MSFQHFRLGGMQFVQPVVHEQQTLASNDTQTSTQFVGQIQTTSTTTRLPYGAGDTDDGYTLVFPNLEAFNKWRTHEEENMVVEFVKGDTHGSKADPPRFKDHTKLVCARHSRSGRKKYIKKHPERVRKVPSRKLEGLGCLASISYKTYFDTDEVRVCYNSQHSHEIGPANLPFTRRGRRAASQQDKGQSKECQITTSESGNTTVSTTNSGTSPSAIASTPTASSTRPHGSDFCSAISMPAPPPNVYMSSQPTPSSIVHQHYPPHPYAAPPSDHHDPMSLSIAQERWERMTVLYQSIRDHARRFEYPAASVVALEGILIRLYLESPVGTGPPTSSHSNAIGGGLSAPLAHGQNTANGLTSGEGSTNRVNGVAGGSEEAP